MKPELVKRLESVTLALSALASDVEKEVNTLSQKPVAEIAAFYFYLKEAHSELEVQRKRVGKNVEFINKGLFPEKLSMMDLDKVQVPELERSFYILTKTSASMIDKERGFDWLRQRGSNSLIQETVNAGTLASFMKDLMVNEGIDPPDDIFKVSTYNTIGMSKYKPK